LLFVGTAQAAPATLTLNIVGALPAKLNATQQEMVGTMFIIARNGLAGTPDGLSDPWPCVSQSEIAGFLPNSVKAYEAFKAGVLKQHYKVEKELTPKNSDQREFLLSKGNTVLLGMWAKAPIGDRSTLAICERAANWKPVPPPTPSATAAAIKGNILAGTAQGWKLGTRRLVILPAVNHDYEDESDEVMDDSSGDEGGLPDNDILASGPITAAGAFQVVLPTGRNIPKNLLRPIEQAILPEDVYYSDDGPCPPTGALKVSLSGVQGLSFDTLTVLKPGAQTSSKIAMERATTVDELSKNGSIDTRAYSSVVRLVYSEKAVSIKGQLTCFSTGYTGKTDINLRLPAGWSQIELLRPNGSNETGNNKIQNAPAVKASLWQSVQR